MAKSIMRRYIITIIYLCVTAFSFGQISVTYKRIGNILNKAHFEESSGNACKSIVADSTSKLWKKLEKEFDNDKDVIKNLKSVLNNIDTLIINLGRYEIKCPVRDSLIFYRDTLAKLYRDKAISDPIVKSFISDLNKKNDSLLLKTIELTTENNIQKDELNKLYWVSGIAILLSLLLTTISMFKAKKAKVKPSDTEGGGKKGGTAQGLGHLEGLKEIPIKTDTKDPVTPPSEQKQEEIVPVKEPQKVKEETPQENRIKATFYMSIPKGEKVFSNDNRSKAYLKGRTFYLFYLLSDTQAEFEFYDEATQVAIAIDKPQTHIIPACEPTNAREINAKGIKTIEKGKAHLEGEIWVVDEKAKIEYVYN